MYLFPNKVSKPVAKSAIVADLLMKKGHKNVKVYNAGEPEWSKKDYLEVVEILNS